MSLTLLCNPFRGQVQLSKTSHKIPHFIKVYNVIFYKQENKTVFPFEFELNQLANPCKKRLNLTKPSVLVKKNVQISFENKNSKHQFGLLLMTISLSQSTTLHPRLVKGWPEPCSPMPLPYNSGSYLGRREPARGSLTSMLTKLAIDIASIKYNTTARHNFRQYSDGSASVKPASLNTSWNLLSSSQGRRGGQNVLLR